MKASPRAFDLIKRLEGFKAKAYPCEAGRMTIGYGTTKGVKKGDTITQAEALRLLAQDVSTAERAVADLVVVDLRQNQFDALTSFVYNIGVSRFAGSTLLKKLNAGDYLGAVKQLDRWIFVRGKISNGQIRRRAIEKKEFLGA